MAQGKRGGTALNSRRYWIQDTPSFFKGGLGRIKKFLTDQYYSFKGFFLWMRLKFTAAQKTGRTALKPETARYCSTLLNATDVKIGMPKHGSSSKIQYSTTGFSKAKLIKTAPTASTISIYPKNVPKNFAGILITIHHKSYIQYIPYILIIY